MIRIPDLVLDRRRTDTNLDRPPLIILARGLGTTLLDWKTMVALKSRHFISLRVENRHIALLRNLPRFVRQI